MTTAAGFPTIFVEYSKELDDYKEAVAEAYRKHNLKPGQCFMIVCPRGSRSLAMAKKAKPLDIDYELLREGKSDSNHRGLERKPERKRRYDY